MNHLDTTVRRLRLVLAAIAALGLLVLPAAASAKRHSKVPDRNHNGIPDKWEKRFHLPIKSPGVANRDPDSDGLTNRGEFLSSTNPRSADTNRNGVTDANEDPDHDGVRNRNEVRERTHPRKGDTNRNGRKDGREDADRDKLNNMGEDQAGTDPMNPDTDGDGVKDGNEEAGRIVSFDGTTLTIALFGGSKLTGTVDVDTFIDCGDGTYSDDSTGDGSSDDPSGDDPSGDDASGVDPSGDDPSGDDPSGDDPSGDEPPADEPPADDPSADEPPADGGSLEKARPRRSAHLDAGSVDPGDDPGVDESDPGVDDGSSDPGTDDGSGGGAGACSMDSLKVGSVVEEASFTATPEGALFDSITLKP